MDYNSQSNDSRIDTSRCNGLCDDPDSELKLDRPIEQYLQDDDDSFKVYSAFDAEEDEFIIDAGDPSFVGDKGAISHLNPRFFYTPATRWSDWHRKGPIPGLTLRTGKWKAAFEFNLLNYPRAVKNARWRWDHRIVMEGYARRSDGQTRALFGRVKIYEDTIAANIGDDGNWAGSIGTDFRVLPPGPYVNTVFYFSHDGPVRYNRHQATRCRNTDPFCPPPVEIEMHATRLVVTRLGD